MWFSYFDSNVVDKEVAAEAANSVSRSQANFFLPFIFNKIIVYDFGRVKIESSSPL